MRPRIRLLVGAGLVLASAVPIVQTLREFWFWSDSAQHYDELVVGSNPVVFAGHTIRVVDDLPHWPQPSEQQLAGTTRVLVDERDELAPRRALVRPGRPITDIGRYHLWVHSTMFVDRRTGDTTVYVGRRLKYSGRDARAYEIVELRKNGSHSVRRLSHGQRDESYPIFRTVQFLNDATPTVHELSLATVLGFALFLFPLSLVVPFTYPLLTLIVGAALVARGIRG